MALQDLSAELVGRVPGLSPFLAQTFVKRAFRDVCNSGRRWSFQVGDASFLLPQVITAGTVGVTQFSQTVTVDATAAAALNAANSNPALIFRQFRVAGSAVYNITAWTAPNGPLTVDRPVLDQTTPNATYQVYQAYYPTPVADFLRWVTLEDPVNAYDLELDHTRQELDVLDPQRQSQNQPYWAVSYKTGSLTGGVWSTTAPLVPYFELWPVPTVQGQLIGTYQRIGTGILVNPADVPPSIVSDELLIEYALGWHAYPWALANSGRIAELKGVNWGFLMTEAKNKVLGVRGTTNPGLLNDARRMDDEIYNTSRIFKRSRSSGRFGPIDSNFFQSHGVPRG